MRFGNKGDEETDKKFQKQRLLLLYHASKCSTGTEICKVPTLCASTKILLKHIKDCNTVPCNEIHCYSSRFVLSHFRICKVEKCEVCGPVIYATQISDAQKKILPQLELEQQHAPQYVGNSNMHILSPEIPPNLDNMKGGQIPALTLIDLPTLLKQELYLTHAQRSFLMPKLQSTSQAASAVVAQLPLNEKTSLTFTEIDACQRIEAVSAAWKQDIGHGFITVSMPKAHTFSAEHQQILDQQSTQPYNEMADSGDGRQKRVLSNVRSNTIRRADQHGCIGEGWDPTNTQLKRCKVESTSNIQNQLATLIPTGIFNETRYIGSLSDCLDDLHQTKNSSLPESVQMVQQLSLSPTSSAENSVAVLTGTVLPQQSNSIRPQQLVGGWQSNIDIPHRKITLSKTVMYLQQRMPNTHIQGWLMKVPEMANHLEDLLYRNSDSFAMYSDLSTLHSRLQHLALKLGYIAQQARLQQQLVVQDELNRLRFIDIIEFPSRPKKGEVLNSALIGLPSLSEEELEALTPAQLKFLQEKSLAIEARINGLPSWQHSFSITYDMGRVKAEARNVAFGLDTCHGFILDNIY